MDDTQVQDLKQFITAEMSYHLGDLESRLTTKIDDLSEAVAQALDTINNSHDADITELKKRVSRLERRIA